ncbi:alpha/beta hydrolase [Nocardia arizonensis]|uniref:alpha/beta hydrolase n=1 Tax=Nocardia arizonensis TaxID=1141647 RepID=UPI0006D0D3A0|nr:alpha/beta hydrolase [Nocardia arizonensis]
MTETIANRPFWQLVFDADGDIDRSLAAALDTEIGATGTTDLVMFSHGWNNGQDTAIRLYRHWFELLAAHLDPNREVGFAGILWPSQLWRDEPIPDFPATVSPRDGAAASAVVGAVARTHPVSPTLEPEILADLATLFPAGARQLEEFARLLAPSDTPPDAAELVAALRAWHDALTAGSDDGELVRPGVPGMLDPGHDPRALLEEFAEALSDTGVRLDSGEGGGEAGVGEMFSRIRQGAKEALRQLSYWQMKARAGVVGRGGVGPLVTRLAASHPHLRVHLVGHSFGGRVVAFALDGLDTSARTPVKSITVLQGAFSRFAFTDSLPFRAGSGALAGRLPRLDGPFTVCYSSHDSALGTLYPLASLAAGEDAAGAADLLFRYRAMGSHGAFEPDHRQPLGGVGTVYPFRPHRILDLDASDVVNQGEPPGGAHGDIFKTELAWVVAAAGDLIRI